jgi:hypothetical protein
VGRHGRSLQSNLRRTISVCFIQSTCFTPGLAGSFCAFLRPRILFKHGSLRRSVPSLPRFQSIETHHPMPSMQYLQDAATVLPFGPMLSKSTGQSFYYLTECHLSPPPFAFWSAAFFHQGIALIGSKLTIICCKTTVTTSLTTNLVTSLLKIAVYLPVPLSHFGNLRVIFQDYISPIARHSVSYSGSPAATIQMSDRGIVVICPCGKLLCIPG